MFDWHSVFQMIAKTTNLCVCFALFILWKIFKTFAVYSNNCLTRMFWTIKKDFDIILLLTIQSFTDSTFIDQKQLGVTMNFFCGGKGKGENEKD